MRGDGSTRLLDANQVMPAGKGPVRAMRRFVQAGGFAVSLVWASAIAVSATASAQGDAAAGFPTHPIKVVVGFAPGGSPDLLARVISQKLSERLKQPVVVENRPGAGAILGAEIVSRAAPDGYTLLMAPGSTLSINPAVYSKLPYDAQKSFEPIALVALWPFLLSVNAGGPIKSVQDLVAWSKANPDKSNYASASAAFQLATELFKMRTGARFEHIPFKSGGEVVSAILTGQVTMGFADAGPVLPQIRSGKVRALATTGPSRSPELPDVPTLKEAGVADMIVESYGGLVAPKGTPPGIIQKLEQETLAVAGMAEVRERISQMGLVPAGETGKEFSGRVAREIAMWTGVAKAANITLD